MENFSLISLLISIPVLVAIDKRLLRLAFFFFLLANVPTVVALFFNIDPGNFWLLFARLNLIVFSFLIIGKISANRDI